MESDLGDETGWVKKHPEERMPEKPTDESRQLTTEEQIRMNAEEIVRSQSRLPYLFGASLEEELDAAMREATVEANVRGTTPGEIAEAAATRSALALADKVAEFHQGDNALYFRHEFLLVAYQLKCLLRCKEKE